ncbi:LAFA_0A00342g1_1 [Lachancea sp. 'fantastica']|nr:LAFA_0A00342g1_1 [Lachancea sp. 'fantastica']
MSKSALFQNNTLEEIKTPVLVVGGSLVGLSAGLFLSFWEVPNIVIEKHEGSSLHPRAIGFTEHTMEFFSSVGIIDQIPRVERGTRLRRASCFSWASEWTEKAPWSGQKKADASPQQEFSPFTGAAIPQDKLEPILRNRAVKLGCDLRQNTVLLGFEQNDDEVIATVLDQKTAHAYKIRAQYMIAADGGKSSIRDDLQILQKGRGYMQTIASVLFRCPEADEVLSRGIVQFEIDQPDLKAFLTTYNDGRWALMFRDGLKRTSQELLDAIKKAVGRTDARIEIITTGQWDLNALICESYSKGRVFLAGDSAHALPPTRGGYGANTGIDDVHNLAWKLKLVLLGKASHSLLDTYSTERQPIGWLRHQQTFARPDYAAFAQGCASDEEIIDDAAMELGQLHVSKAICGPDDTATAAKRPDLWQGQPGVRAPHVWVKRDGKDISMIELFNKHFVVLSQNEEWLTATEKVSAALELVIDFYLVGKDIVFHSGTDFEKTYGVDQYGATLVRPDGIVGWRAKQKQHHPISSLQEALNQILRP